MHGIWFAVFLLAAFSSASEAWTSQTYQLIVVNSVKLMPASFRNIMLQHQKEILSGSLKPDEQGESAHQYDPQTRSGFLQDRVTDLTIRVPQKIYDHVSFREIAFDFGGLAHYMADLNDPLLLGNSDDREPQYRTDFDTYLEKNIQKFPWIFDGHENSFLNRSDIPGFAYSIASFAVGKYPLLGEAYFPNGSLVSSDTFDWKSLPFGIASLSYSHSISNTVQIWFYVWKKAHGDLSNTPFYSKKTKSRSRP